ncbi:MAG: DUF5611 family protein [Candidatus Thermoplasmatota archaeon]|nr:DUF5611 family protein [Candidatus Thermoplasmatota archaeon]
MQEYELKRGLQDNLRPDNLKKAMQETFGNVMDRDGKLVSSYGALKQLSVWAGKKTLCVETQMDPSVANDIAANTIKAYNTFLEKVTGLTAKERGKKAQKKAKDG